MAYVATPKPAVAYITLGSLINGICQYLAHLGITVGRCDFEAIPGDSTWPSETNIALRGINESGTPWPPHQYIFCKLNGKACKTLSSRVGDGPFSLTLVATKEVTRLNDPHRTVAEIVVTPQRERSLLIVPARSAASLTAANLK